MPHLIIEHSANVAELADIQSLVDQLHAAALDNGLPAISVLRTRAVSRNRYRIADGGSSYAFVVITARIGPGRSAADKRAFLECLIDAAERELAPAMKRLTIAFSAEIQEIDPEFRINRNHIETAFG
jgi:5-carboxymethyl-2-hydroxymuconate isomerase